MRILVLGAYYSSNLGDGIICECVAGQLKSAFPTAEIVIKDLMNRSSFHKEEPSDMIQLEKIKFRMKIRAALSRFTIWDKELKNQENRIRAHRSYISDVCKEKYDIAVFAGGQIFRDRFAFFIEEYVKYLIQNDTKIYFNACGMGPLSSKAIQKRLGDVFRNPNVKLISSRDNGDIVSRLCLKEEGRIIDTFDPALWADVQYGVKKKADSSVVGLGMMYPWNLNTRKAAVYWRNLIHKLDENGIEWRVFTNGDHNDMPFVEYVFSDMEEYCDSFHEYIMKIPQYPEDLVRLVGEFDAIISFRLHSHIIAASLRVPSIAVVWDEKVKCFFEKIQCGNRCVSIGIPPEETIQRLKAAQREGYAHCNLDERRKDAYDLLVQSIRDTWKEDR